ncbi:MAG TPA: transporter [Steroidobacteraceae bacterium]|nr:transporter [Steroidobacteraceae bacterium]
MRQSTLAFSAALLCAALLCAAHLAHAQELNPRAYVITPVGTNVINLGYSHIDGNPDLSGAAPITDAHGSVDLTALGYYRGFGFFGRSANVALGIPYGVGDFSGNVSDVPKHVRRSGFLDSSLRLSVNLLGGPAMEPQEFAKWQQDILLGVSLKIVAPTGQYDPTVLVNLGNNRWAFKPEIGYSQRWNHWILDGYAGVWFFTKNPEFFSHNQYFPGVQSQTQRPMMAFETHLSYDVRPRLWISLDANFWAGGETSVNGVASPQTSQRSSRIGVTASIPLSAHHSIKVSYSDGAYVRYGGNYRTLSASWQYAWFGWPFH